MIETAWSELLKRLHAKDVEVAAHAAEALHKGCTVEDVPRLRRLILDADNFFIREAAAWPLAELAGVSALPELIEAIARGEAEGHDNDGLNAATLEVLYADPEATRAAVERLLPGADDRTKPILEWLLEFERE